MEERVEGHSSTELEEIEKKKRIQFRSIEVSTRSGKATCPPPCLWEVSQVLPLE